jgi:hypothetical protein
MPVSSNGARVRMVLYYKRLEALVDIVSPVDAYGGLKTPAFLALNPQGKMPIFVVPAHDASQPDGVEVAAWAEADTIARHILDRFAAHGPSLVGETLAQRTLCNAVAWTHLAHISIPKCSECPFFNKTELLCYFVIKNGGGCVGDSCRGTTTRTCSRSKAPCTKRRRRLGLLVAASWP